MKTFFLERIKFTWLLFFLSFFSFPLFAQDETKHTNFSCGSDLNYQSLLNSDPNFQEEQALYEQIYQKSVQSGNSANQVQFDIPIVVHIIHAGQALGTDQNPTDASIISDINISSQRFRHAHAGADTYSNPNYGADTEINLCLATTDPMGNFTTGITRHYDPDHTVGDYIDLLPFLNNYAWDRTKYCNLFIVNSTNAAGVYIGGFQPNTTSDFTIYDSGIWNTGLIAHELGHYFSLRHPFQGSSCDNGNCLTSGDLVCDTPPVNTSGLKGGSCAMPNNTCTTDDDDLDARNPYRPVANGGIGDQPDMLANYMDYTGSCWDAFTLGQKTRMHVNINTNRTDLAANTAACATQATPANEVSIGEITTTQTNPCTDNFTAAVEFTNIGSATLTSLVITLKNLTNNSTTVVNWSGSLAPNATTMANFTPITIPVGDHLMEATLNNPNSAPDANLYNNVNYAKVTYIGGTMCNEFSNCANFNAATAAGPGNMTTVSVTATFPTSSSSTVRICPQTQGDVGFSLETFRVLDENGNNIGNSTYDRDCTVKNEICYDVSVAAFQGWASDGVVTFNFDPISTEINPTLCGINEACIKIIVPTGTSSASCNDNLIVTGNPVTNSQDAGATLTTVGTCIINSGATINFKAENSIQLNEGFYVKSGANFTAKIATCTAPFTEPIPVTQLKTALPTNDLPIFKIYPNPFNSQATIAIDLPKDGLVNLTIYNQFGQQVYSPINHQKHSKGRLSIALLTDQLSPGIYFVNMVYGGKKYTKKLIRMK